MISVFTPSFADEANTNAQNLTVKEVVARLSPEEFRVAMFADGVPDQRIAARKNTTLFQWRAHGNTVRTAARFLSQIPDVYFFPREGPLDSALLGMRKHGKLTTALATYIVSGLDQGFIRSSVLRNITYADVVVGNSRWVSDVVARHTGASVRTIYDGVDQRYYYPTKTRSEKGELVVLYAGSFRPWKRPHMVVEQAARWPKVQFRMAGAGEEEPRCRQMAQELECKNVVFMGHLSQSQLGEAMRRADIFFFPSEQEGHPQVLAQAAACGLPCIAMNSYQPEFVCEGETGFLARNDAELSESLRRLLHDPDLRQSMSAAAVVHMRQFQWEIVAAQWAEVFKEITTARRKPRLQG